MNRRMEEGRQPVSNQVGHCLAEFLIAMTAGAVVLSAAVQSLSHFGNRLLAQQQAVSGDQDLRIGLMVMAEELRRAMVGPSGAMLLSLDRQEITFLQNLDGATAVLTEAAAGGQQEIKAVGAAGWAKGKRIMLCDEEQCVESRLARDGQNAALQLTAPLGQGFASGTTVWLVSQMRYYLGKDQVGRKTLMRQIDGGANPLIGNIAGLAFRYLDKDGRPTEEPARTARLRMEISASDGRAPLARDVALTGM
jgi:hypothetical protein